ncbi:hypothetical protein NL676_013433 [Syzygium grande]|nr:hypothetical protein NL676_013433 [Syzygium grande]
MGCRSFWVDERRHYGRELPALVTVRSVLPLLLPSSSLNCSFLLRSNARSLRSVLSEQESLAQSRAKLAQSRAKLAHGPATSSGTPRWRCRCLIRCVVPGSTRPRREFGRDRVRESSIRRRVSSDCPWRKSNWLGSGLFWIGPFNRWRARNSKLH